MAQNFNSLDLTVAQTDGPFKIDYPLMSEGDTKYKEVRQPLGCFTANYTPPVIGSSAPSDVVSGSGGGTLYCAGDFNFTETETLITKFTRLYNNRPFDVSGSGSGSAGIQYEYESYTYTYPGMYSDLLSSLGGRNPVSVVVPSKIEKKYYVIGVDVPTVPEIPLIQPTKYYYVNGALSDFVSSDQMYLNNGGAGVLASFPTLNNYRVQIAFDSTSSNNWTTVPEGSTLERFRSNIYIRSTRYIPTI